MFRKAKENDGIVWQDHDVRFDVGLSLLHCRRGEKLLEWMDEVEDTKGANGEIGQLRITNLRVMWISESSRRTNLSIGLNNIVSLTYRSLQSRLNESGQSLVILTRHNASRFEFIFTGVNGQTMPHAFLALSSIHRMYQASTAYRDLLLRTHIVSEGELKLLPLEQVYNKVHGVWNLSSEQGNLGVFYITNVRVVWFAQLAENFNVSVPFLQIKSVRTRDSKFGRVLVVETTKHSGGYVLGFKVDPQDRLEQVMQEIRSLWEVYLAEPVFGVDYHPEHDRDAPQPLPVTEQDVEALQEVPRDVLAAYYADAAKALDREPVYNAELGLAMEQLRDGVTLQQLWSVL